MRLLFTSTAGLGHLFPLLPLARAAVEAGHEITFATPVKDPAHLRELGVRHVALDEPSEADCDQAGREHPTTPFELILFGRLKPSFAVPGIRSLTSSWQPDVVVSEMAEFAGGLMAEQLGVPLVRVHPGVGGRGTFEHLVAPQLATVRHELGLPADPDARGLLEAPQISYFPAAFDERLPGDPAVCRVRNQPVAASNPRRTDTVYITFGTEIVSAPFFPQLVRDAVAAASRTGLHIVLSVGRADLDQFADLPDVSIERWVDQDALLPTVRAVVCHAGAGTTLGALTAGTPIVAVPFFADQPFNAERIDATRTGVLVPPGDNLTDRLTDALNRVIHDEPPGCRAMAAAVRDLPDIGDALDLITSQRR